LSFVTRWSTFVLASTSWIRFLSAVTSMDIRPPRR
jgi:hypothetical protein